MHHDRGKRGVHSDGPLLLVVGNQTKARWNLTACLFEVFWCHMATSLQAAQIVLPTSNAVDGRLSSCVALLSTRSLAVAPGGKFAALLRPAELHLLNLGEMTHHSRIPGQEVRKSLQEKHP